MEIKCSSCNNHINIKQQYLYHAGFSNMGFLYCDNCSTILKFGTYNTKYKVIVGEKHPWSLNESEKLKLEKSLKKCPYCKTGKFIFAAKPRCPVCSDIIPDLLKDNIHFVELGRVVDGDKDDCWNI